MKIVFMMLALCAGSYAAQEKTWLLAIEHSWGAFSYIDTAGYFKGFSYDLSKAVCKAAGVKCDYVFDTPINCVTNKPGEHAVLGTGLQAGYYDACISWQVTTERVHFGKFSMPYAIAVESALFYKKGGSFDLKNWEDKTIGFLQGWTGDEKCLARKYTGVKGIPLKTPQIKYFTTAVAIKNALIETGNGTKIDAAFVLINGLDKYKSELAYDKDSVKQCTLGGASCLTRKDNPFVDIWNFGYDAILRNGELKRVCELAATSHNGTGKIDCVKSFDFSI